jgi:hypothetical protein
MPAITQTSSQHRAPLEPSERHLHAAGVTIRGERPEVSAVRTYDQLADKARQMCGSGAPVVFTAVDWGLPRLVGDDVELIFTVHTGHRVAIRLAREKAARLHEALGMILAEGGVAAPAPVAPGRAILPLSDAIDASTVESAWQKFRAGTASVAELARQIGCSDITLRNAFGAAYPVEYDALRHAYMGRRRGPMLKTWMDRQLAAIRLPVTKPSGQLL